MAILTRNMVKSSHWYTRLGEPMHRIMKADGSGDRATTLADAKRLKLLPSVTGILGVLAKPALESWKMDQVALATLRTPKAENEAAEYWCRRVKDAAFEQVEDAADLGSEIHAALECATAGEPWDAGRFGVYVQPVLDFIAREGLCVTGREKRLVNGSHGFAGQTDLLYTWGGSMPGILDYKTKKTKPGEKVSAYDEHRLQLAAYAATEYGEASLPTVKAFNVFVSSTEPGRVEFVQHGDLSRDWAAFKMLASIWRYAKGYDPRFAQERD
ncbi:MAG TPA: PD-(D/E)XK nuclease family protein [Kiritimatiellia bacterium]|nr:PD-(D/E)XK nuclease family protein [Kiritimatiellia bacterium]